MKPIIALLVIVPAAQVAQLVVQSAEFVLLVVLAQPAQ